MPAYSFQKNFVPLILNGSKPHTIRSRRKYPTKVGDKLALYTGMRTKQCMKITDAVCIRVVPINIYPGQQVILDGQYISVEEISKLSSADGFESVDAFFRFFEDHYALPTFGFELIEWDPKQLVINPLMQVSYDISVAIERGQIPGSVK